MTMLLKTGDAISLLQKTAAKSVDLVMGSPPYAEKGERYGTGKKLPTPDWVAWMTDVTEAALRVVTNAVVWVVNGSVKNGRYLPACEGLVWHLHMKGVTCERPAIWHKNAPPNRKDWFGNDWEYCLCFRPDDSTRYFDWESIGSPRKYSSGGKFRQRDSKGQRRIGGSYPTNPITRPRDVIRATVGGGHLGSPLASLNAAPYPEKIVEPFLQTLVPVGGIVLDPFCGSGTTLAVAKRFGRHGIGFDIDPTQITLTRKRLKATPKCPSPKTSTSTSSADSPPTTRSVPTP